MSSYLCNPTEGHFMAVLKIYGYLKDNASNTLILDPGTLAYNVQHLLAKKIGLILIIMQKKLYRQMHLNRGDIQSQHMDMLMLIMQGIKLQEVHIVALFYLLIQSRFYGLVRNKER